MLHSEQPLRLFISLFWMRLPTLCDETSSPIISQEEFVFRYLVHRHRLRPCDHPCDRCCWRDPWRKSGDGIGGRIAWLCDDESLLGNNGNSLTEERELGSVAWYDDRGETAERY